MAKIPFFLVTGFLGSGKTTLLKKFLSQYADNKRVLLVQNEFSQVGVDGAELQACGFKFSMLEVNRGSVFCACLFLDFVSLLAEQLEREMPDLVVMEATGVADPIAVAQLINNPLLGRHLYLAHIWSIVDALNILKMKEVVRCIPNQIRVADTVIVNKCDWTEEAVLPQIDAYIKEVNPFARLVHTNHCDLDFDYAVATPFRLLTVVERGTISGELTKCNERELTSHTYKSTKTFDLNELNTCLLQLPENIYRLKGFVRLSNGGGALIQCTSGQYSLESIRENIVTTELIAIGWGDVALPRWGLD